MATPILRNAAANILGESLWGFQSGLVASATVLTIILTRYGAGKTMVSSIVAIETLGFILPQIVGVYVFRRWRQKRVPLVVYHLVFVVPLLFVMSLLLRGSAGLPAAAMRWGLLALYAAFVCLLGVIVAVWMDWLATLFPVKIRGTVIGLTFGSSALAGALGTLVSGRILGVVEEGRAYPLLYLLAGIIGVAALCMYLMVKEEPAGGGGEDAALTARGIIASALHSLSDRNFRQFLIGRILAVAGFSVLPFITLHYLSDRGGRLAADLVVTISAAQTLGMALGNIGIGRLGDRCGHRLGLIVSAGLQVVTLALLLCTSGVFSCAVVYFLAGVCTSAGFLAHYNMMFETCPHGFRAVHITAGNVVFSLGTAGIPLIGGAVASRVGLQAVFGASLVLSVAAVVWYPLFVKEPRMPGSVTAPGRDNKLASQGQPPQEAL